MLEKKKKKAERTVHLIVTIVRLSTPMSVLLRLYLSLTCRLCVRHMTDCPLSTTTLAAPPTSRSRLTRAGNSIVY